MQEKESNPQRTKNNNNKVKRRNWHWGCPGERVGGGGIDRSSNQGVCDSIAKPPPRFIWGENCKGNPWIKPRPLKNYT